MNDFDPVEILLAEDSDADAEMTIRALQGNLRSATFGKPTAIVGNMRQVEIGFRLNF